MIRILSMLTLASTMTIATQAQAIFTSPDPLDPTIPGVGTNRYSYSFNDPINGRDPSGYCEESHGCEGEWGPLEGEPSEVQTPDGLQDVSNFGGPNPTYGADPKKFKTTKTNSKQTDRRTKKKAPQNQNHFETLQKAAKIDPKHSLSPE